MKTKFIIFLFFGAILAACQDDLPLNSIPQENCHQYDPSKLFAEWESQNTTETRSGQKVYPGWYGGCFAEDDLLVMQCTDIDKINLIPEGAKYRICKYSYNELDSVKEIISERMEKVDREYGSNVICYGISGKLNRILVVLHDASDEKIEKFKNHIYSGEEFLAIRNVLELVYSTSTYGNNAETLPLWPDNYIVCGSTLLNLYTNNEASLGYRVKDKNGKKGFMTAGHFVYEGLYVTNADRDTIGLCKQCYRRNLMDASYCELTDNNYELSNNIRTFAIDTLSSISVSPIVDADIIAVGSRNSYQGKVLCASSDFTFYDDEGRLCTYTDQILLDFTSTPGNSGGVVCFRDKNTNKLETVGILCGNMSQPTSPVFGRIVAFCCKQVNIQGVMGVKRY